MDIDRTLMHVLCRVALLLGLLGAARTGNAQLLEQVLSPEFTLTTQAAPTTQVLLPVEPITAVPESLVSLPRPLLRAGVQVDDLLHIRSASETTDFRLNRSYLQWLTPGAGSWRWGAELLRTWGDETRDTRTTELSTAHDARSFRLTAVHAAPGAPVYALQLLDGRADIDGETNLIARVLKNSQIRDFRIDGQNRHLLATVSSRPGAQGYTARVGWRALEIPLTIFSPSKSIRQQYTGAGPMWELRGWRQVRGIEMGVLVNGQHAEGDDLVRYNGARQGITSSAFRSRSVGVAGRWGDEAARWTAQLLHTRAEIDGDARMIYPLDDDFLDYLGGTGVVRMYLDAKATSAHLGWASARGRTTYRAGYQLALVDVTAGFTYHTQFMAGGVRDAKGEETRIRNGTLHLLGGGVERRFGWGSIGYGLIFTIPQDFSRTTRDFTPDITRAPARSRTVSGGMVHTLRVEWWF